MFKIGEFSQMAQISTRMLRHYDKLGLLQPDIVDRFTGYRYYTLDQIPRLHRILALKDLGFSLQEVAELLHDNLSVAEMQGMLKMRQTEITRTLIEEQARLARVASRLRQIEQGGNRVYDIIMKKPESMTVVAQRDMVPHIDDMASYRCTMFEDVYTWIGQSGVKPAGPEWVIYYGEEFSDTQIDMEIAVPIAEEAAAELAPYTRNDMQIRTVNEDRDLAVAIHQGSIHDIPQAIVSLFTWINSNGFASSGIIRELHLSGPENAHTDFENIHFELQIPVMQKA